MISYLAFVLRGMGEQQEAEGQALVLAALRILQDCPSMAISARKVGSISTSPTTILISVNRIL